MNKKILAWSQMHGNEATTTKSVCDLINVLSHSNKWSKQILENCSFKIIPILNPDGAIAYTRSNANNVDLNRDAQSLSEPESRVLRQVFDDFKPDYCLNLHGQRSIFGVGDTGKSATVSFLSPAEDENRTITETRKKAMQVIIAMNEVLQIETPGQVGRYDDAFNINCVGDTFQSLNVPTILFEAGHLGDDYEREQTRFYIFQALITGLTFISGLSNKDNNQDVEAYYQISENKKNFYDLIIRKTSEGAFGFHFKETLRFDKIHFSPELKEIGNLHAFFGHLEMDAKGAILTSLKGERPTIGDEIDFVMLNNEKFALKPKNN